MENNNKRYCHDLGLHTSFIVGASDLHPMYNFNIMVKYADDSYLLVGSTHVRTATD